MADSQGNNSLRLRRNISKIAFRNKERVMRSIGRAEETKDEIIDHYVMLINKQQIQMQKLQRDMKQYLQALKAMSLSQKAFYSSLYDVYEDDWTGKDVVSSCSLRNESLFEDVFARFQSEVLELLQNHLSEYQKCKACVEKRGRKLVDYDAAKRAMQAIESTKKPDPNKVEKSRENLRQTREIYEELNNFLHQQLPTLYDARLSVCVNIFSSICESENVFSSEVGELRTKLNTVLLNLKSSFDNGEYRIQRMQTPLDNGVASGSPGSSSSPRLKNPPPQEHVASIHNSDTVPAPRTSSENDAAKPNDDPSTHEYVNLQVGPLPSTVKQISQEEEHGSGDGQGDKKLDENTYMTPNVPYEPSHTEYMMASDFVSLARRSRPVGMSYDPRTSHYHHIFRNPSDRRVVKPPIPKSLPRTLSAPSGQRPVVERHPKHHPHKKRPSYADVRRPFNGCKTKFTSYEARPKKRKRPKSMILPASAAKLSVHKETPGKTKDDGSGSADKEKNTDQHGDEKAQKGLFGLLGLRRLSRSSKNINSAHLSAAPNEKTAHDESTSQSSKNNETSDAPSFKEMPRQPSTDNADSNASVVPVAVAVTAVSASAAMSSDTDGNSQTAVEDTEVQYDVPAKSPCSEIGSLPKQEKESANETDDETVTEDTEGEAVKEVDGEINHRNHHDSSEGEIKKMEAGEGNVFVINDVAFSGSDKLPSDGEVQRTTVDQTEFPKNAFEAFQGDGFGEVEPFADFDSAADESAAFGDATRSPDVGFQDGFTDSFTAATQLQVDGFSREPFESFNETADVVLDGDESVFDPNNPISPDHFKAIHDAYDFKASNSRAKLGSSDVSISSYAGSDDSIEHPVMEQNLSDGARTEIPSEQVEIPSLPGVKQFDSETVGDHIIKEQSHEIDELDRDADRPSDKQGDIDDPISSATKEINISGSPEESFGASNVGHRKTLAYSDSTAESNAVLNGPIGFQSQQPYSNTTVVNDDDLYENDDAAKMAPSTVQHDSGTSCQLDKDEDNFYENAEDMGASDVQDVFARRKPDDSSGPYENVFFNDSQDIVSKSDIRDNEESDVSTSNAAQEFPLPVQTQPPIDESLEIPPIYEEPPREDIPADHPLPVRSKYPRLPPNYLFSVQALYKYRSTDDDELSFGKGDIIHIIVHPDPEEQDDGWQMGIRQEDWDEKGENASMGVFPENFTKQIHL